jgi:TolA-binding protein
LLRYKRGQGGLTFDTEVVVSLTLRPTDRFSTHLNRLKSQLDIKTSAGCIDYVVTTYESKIESLKSTEQKLKETQGRLDELIGILNNKASAENQLRAIEQQLDSFLKPVINGSQKKSNRIGAEKQISVPFCSDTVINDYRHTP